MNTREHRPCVRASTTILASLILICGTTASADINGKWRIEEATGATVFIDVSQVGDLVSFELDGHAFCGQLSGSVLRASDFLSANRGRLAAIVSPDETILRGSMGFLDTFPLAVQIAGQRCQCFDNDSNDGDGCNALCQIAACFTCETPSSCVPSANGAPCDDGDICTVGESCTERLCGDGSAVSPCIDVSGTWRWESVLTDPIEQRSERAIRFVQSGTFLEVLALPAFGAAYAGSIDPTTGAFALHGIAGSSFGIQCDETGNSGIRGQVGADGRSLTGVLTFVGGPTPSCATFDAALSGSRCGGASDPCVQCPGDCNGDASVTVDELVRSVGITLNTRSLAECVSSDADVDGVVTVSELVSAVRNLLAGCPEK